MSEQKSVKERSEDKFKSPSGLTLKQLRFCMDYIRCGCEASLLEKTYGYSSRVASSYLRNDSVKQFLIDKMAKMEQKFDITFEELIGELIRIKDLCVPHEAETHAECNIKGGLSAISEINKMKGNYAVKKIELSQDKDVEDGNKIAMDYIKSKERDY